MTEEAEVLVMGTGGACGAAGAEGCALAGAEEAAELGFGEDATGYEASAWSCGEGFHS